MTAAMENIVSLLQDAPQMSA